MRTVLDKKSHLTSADLKMCGGIAIGQGGFLNLDFRPRFPELELSIAKYSYFLGKVVTILRCIQWSALSDPQLPKQA
jgi:hypothetical protein